MLPVTYVRHYHYKEKYLRCQDMPWTTIQLMSTTFKELTRYVRKMSCIFDINFRVKSMYIHVHVYMHSSKYTCNVHVHTVYMHIQWKLSNEDPLK